MKKFVGFMGILQIIMAIVMFVATCYFLDKDGGLVSMLKEGETEDKIIGAVLVGVPIVRALTGLIAAIGRGKGKGLLIFLGILLVIGSIPSSKTVAGMIPITIVSLVINVIFLISVIAVKKDEA